LSIKNHNNQATCRVLAYDKHQQHYMGAVADISPNRLALLSNTHIQPDTILELQLQCDDRRPGLHGAYLGTRVMWCEVQDGAYWAELRIISVEQKTRQRLAQLRAISSLDTPDITSLTA